MLRIENVYKRFKNGFIALDNLNLQIQPGEIVSLIGTSGCGKSTLLRLIAGLDHPTTGTVSIDHETIAAPHPEVGIIFQEPRLMPWLTVWDNVRFGLEKMTRDQQTHRVASTLAKVGLTEFAQALPRQLSGGMAQRVAIARALVTQPSILLLDEPFSALDAFTRMKLQDHLLHIWSEDRPTLIFVTHDVEEALVMSDRIIVMRGNPGRIHREFRLGLPRPRKRTEPDLQHWKERLLAELDLSLEDLPSVKPSINFPLTQSIF
ncbi:ABC transporter ATP-binding protein [Leptolyngbya ohadii]|uniref:ABC transporter ATP-binding protein n=1 Tax=Leptolyngbya ohadii TaxID=1962290 RepID=UPI000B59CD08|nr:ABC transporter ATP-binding protein [Leptolyngbya ohadii]